MSKERLSKLQKTILNVIKKAEKEEHFDNSHWQVGYDVQQLLCIDGYEEVNSFRVRFCNSIRNLEKKGLIKLTFKSIRKTKARVDKIFLTEEYKKTIVDADKAKRYKTLNMSIGELLEYERERFGKVIHTEYLDLA